jgi:hypothetical protein
MLLNSWVVHNLRALSEYDYDQLRVWRAFEKVDHSTRFGGKPVVSMGRRNTPGRTQFALKTKVKSLAEVRTARALPWLGFARV